MVSPNEGSRLTFPSMGSDSVALRLTELIFGGINNDPIYTDVVFVRVGNTAVVLTFFSADYPIALTTEERVAREAIGRVAAAHVAPA